MRPRAAPAAPVRRVPATPAYAWARRPPRHRRAADRQRLIVRSLRARTAAPARGDRRARFVEQRESVALADLEDVLLEHPILLPLFEHRCLEIGRERLQNFCIGGDIAADFFR